MIQLLLEARAKKCTKFRWFFGVWENLEICFQDLLILRGCRFFLLLQNSFQIFKNISPLKIKALYGVSFKIKVSNYYLKVSKSRKQNTKFAHTPKNQRNFVHFFALVSKSGSIKKIKALYGVR